MKSSLYQFTKFTDSISEESMPLPTDNTVGFKKVTEKIHVFSEFVPLKSVVLGYMSKTSRIPYNDELFIFDDDTLAEGQPYPSHTI